MSKYSDIDFLEEFIGKEWLQAEYQKIEKKAPYKGVGVNFSNYHPWVCYMYEILYLIRRADADGDETVVLGEYHYYLSNAGALLRYNIDFIKNKDDMISKLKHPNQFHDVVWELEVLTMLRLLGYSTEMIDPVKGHSYDLESILHGRVLAIECKNKIVDKSIENANNLFSHAFTTKIEHVKELHGKVVQISFDRAYFEDIKGIIKEVKKNFIKYKQVKVLERYKLKELNKSININPEKLLMDRSVRNVMVSKSVLKKELYSKTPTSESTNSVIVFRYPEPERKIKNLNKVLNGANKQLVAGGVVFLRVPKNSFDDAVEETKKELRLGLRNISAVKVVANDAERINEQGVKIWRKEELVVSERDDVSLQLTDEELKILNQNMVFTKYAKAHERMTM